MKLGINLGSLYLLLFFLFFFHDLAQADASLQKTVVEKSLYTNPDNPTPGAPKVGMDITTLSVELPLYRKMHPDYNKPTMFINQLAVSQRKLLYDWPTGVTEYKPDTVTAINYNYDFVTPLNANWVLVQFTSLGVFSDFNESVGDSDTLAELGVIGAYQFSNGWDVGIGPVYTRAFGESQLLPAPYLRYKSKKAFAVDVKIPQFAKVSYTHNDKMMFTVAARRSFQAFHINPPVTDPIGSHSATFADVNLGFEALFVVHKNIALELSAARTLARGVQIKLDSNGQTYDRELDNATYYSIGFRYIL